MALKMDPPPWAIDRRWCGNPLLPFFFGRKKPYMSGKLANLSNFSGWLKDWVIHNTTLNGGSCFAMASDDGVTSHDTRHASAMLSVGGTRLKRRARLSPAAGFRGNVDFSAVRL